MKITSRFALLALIGASLALQTQAQPRRHAGGPPQRPQTDAAATDAQPKAPPVGADRSQAMAEHLASVYATLRLQDTDHDAKLSESEQAVLAKGIADGSIRPDHPGRPLPATVSSERAAHMASRMAEVYAKVTVYDTDRDGKLDANEQAALAKAAADGTLKLPPGGPGEGRGPRHGGNGPTAEEREAMHQKLLKTYDTNQDGKLDQAEREAIQADVESGKLELPGRPGQGGGRGRGPRN